MESSDESCFYDAVIQTPIANCNLGIVIGADALLSVYFLSKNISLIKPSSGLAKVVVEQLNAYFFDSSFVFDIPLSPEGTNYQRRVWHALTEIRSGECRTYGELSTDLRSSPRAVGNACRRNPIPIIVPCHRVVAASGIGGFMGQRGGGELDIKRWLLKHENVSWG